MLKEPVFLYVSYVKIDCTVYCIKLFLSKYLFMSDEICTV